MADTEGRLSLIDRVVKLWDPVQLQLWLDQQRHRSGVRAFAVRQTAIFFLTFRHLRDDEVSRRAAALTYYTLLSLVPVLAVGFALFKSFGGLRKVEKPLKEFILDNIAVGNADQVGAWLDSFVNNVSSGAIAGVGLLVLFYSAVGMLTNTEKSFNRIFGVEKMRPLHLRFAIYWCLITLAPPLLGVSLSLSARLQSSSFATTVMQWLPLGLGRLLISGVAALAICAAFVLAYMIVPNTRVRFRAALLGGIVAGLLWTASKALFLWLSTGSAKYSAIYGVLSALPLLIMWLYYSWLITLFGATYAFANQTVASKAMFAKELKTTPRFRLRLASRLTGFIARSFAAQSTPPTAEELAEKVGVMLPVVRLMLDFLVDQRLLLETPTNGDTGYLPGRDLEQLTVADLSQALWRSHGVEPTMDEGVMGERLTPLLERAEAASDQALGSLTLRVLAAPQSPARSR